MWICDACGTPIERVEDGWIEWIDVADGDDVQSRDLRLVHQGHASPQRTGCQFDADAERNRDGGTVSDLPLESFLESDGLMTLLLQMHRRRLPLDEVIEMTKRLHIPGYERAHFHFDEAIAHGVFTPNGPSGFYEQSDIEATNRFIDERRA